MTDEAKTVLCYGDSNTWGCAPKAAHEPDIAERWTGVLQAHLEDVYIVEEGLNGRTTTQPDPTEGEHKNGLSYLQPCLESHAPLDLVILMLGTNDMTSLAYSVVTTTSCSKRLEVKLSSQRLDYNPRAA